MAKVRSIYKCSACGAASPQWKGQCPACQEWNTLELVQQESRIQQYDTDNTPVPLSQVSSKRHQPYKSGIRALDHILGNGLVPGAAILLGGEPGIGKSTLLLQVAQAVAAQERTVLYASGEEALAQIKSRGERLGDLPESLLAISTSRVEDVLAVLRETRPTLVIVDSVQTLTSMAAEGLPGNVNQVRAVATGLLETCRATDTTLVLVGHVTKDGALAGPRLLEHMVDTVISLEGDRRQMFRLLRVFKNRFGPNEELLVFHMGQKGMEVIDDPSTFFLGARDPALSGAAVVMALDGRRPLAVEVQALANRTFLSIPRRTALGFDVNRLHLLLAVMEKRLKLNFGQMDIYAKVGGGIKLSDPGLDLALSAAILSSCYDMALPEKCVLWGEIDPNGQIRPVSGDHLRLAQARRLGFSPIISPQDAGKQGINAIADLGRKLFCKKQEH